MSCLHFSDCSCYSYLYNLRILLVIFSLLIHKLRGLASQAICFIPFLFFKLVSKLTSCDLIKKNAQVRKSQIRNPSLPQSWTTCIRNRTCQSGYHRSTAVFGSPCSVRHTYKSSFPPAHEGHSRQELSRL